MWKTIALAAALAVAGGAAQAQSKRELAQKVVQLQQPALEVMARNIAGQTANQVLAGAAQALQRAPADKREAAGKDIQAEVAKFHDEIEPMLRKRMAELAPVAMVPVLESRLSEDELKQTVAWMESSAAKKLEQALPEMRQALAQKLIAETKTSVDARIKTLEAAVRKRLEAAGVPLPPPGASAPKK